MQINKLMYKEFKDYPERIIQFGDGNFLRAFPDWIVHRMNKDLNFDSGILVVGPRKNNKVYELNDQDGLYTLMLKGIRRSEIIDENLIINSITRGINTYRDYNKYLKAAEDPHIRFMISNTTEAGIIYDNSDKLEDRPQNSFPGKLTSFLYHRYRFFQGNKDKGLLFLPCELIDRNGEKLKEIILKLAEDWELDAGFSNWINEANTFYNTLVDRIVPGYPKENSDDIEKELGYEDKFLVEAEEFHLWVIEGPTEIRDEFPADKIGLNVLFVNDLTPYRTRKVRILNGAHTTMVPVAYMYGLDTVRDSVEHELVGEFIRSTIFDEIVPAMDFPKLESEAFASDTLDRFRNPFIKHYLMSISLNSMSKFETRVLPSILDYIEKEGELPNKLLFSFASLIEFYKGERDGEKIKLSDNVEYLDLFSRLWGDYDGTDEYLEYIVETVLGLEELWKMNLNDLEGFKERVTKHLISIEERGMKTALREVLR